MDKVRFLAIFAMVINCVVEHKSKSGQIRAIADAARRFLGIMDVTGEEVDAVLREEELKSSQTAESGYISIADTDLFKMKD